MTTLDFQGWSFFVSTSPFYTGKGCHFIACGPSVFIPCATSLVFFATVIIRATRTNLLGFGKFPHPDKLKPDFQPKQAKSFRSRCLLLSAA
jgi:hypothetical protein